MTLDAPEFVLLPLTRCGLTHFLEDFFKQDKMGRAGLGLKDEIGYSLLDHLLMVELTTHMSH